MGKLYINDLYESINGECGEIPQGARVTILRLQGCNLTCPWCDAPETQSFIKGNEQSIYTLAGAVKNYNNKHILITGGEPLLQIKPLRKLIKLLAKEKNIKNIQIETNGTIPYPCYDKKVTLIYDHKPRDYTTRPISMTNIQHGSWIKFVISDISDFYTAMAYIDTIKHKKLFYKKLNYAMTAVDKMTTKQLAGMILNSNRHDIVLNTQLHKLIDHK